MNFTIEINGKQVSVWTLGDYIDSEELKTRPKDLRSNGTKGAETPMSFTH